MHFLRQREDRDKVLLNREDHTALAALRIGLVGIKGGRNRGGRYVFRPCSCFLPFQALSLYKASGRCIRPVLLYIKEKEGD